MGVLVIMPDWSSPSERWMGRMIDALGGRVAGVAAFDAPENGVWPGTDVPALRLEDRPVATSGWRPWFRRRPRGASAARTLADACARPDVDRLLVHYLRMALRYEDVLKSSGKPLFVHGHGYDLFWDYRTHEAPDRPAHPPDYVERVRRLADHAEGFVVNSMDSAARLRAIGVPDAKVFVKFYGVPAPSTPPGRHTGDELNVLYLGRLVDFKGPDRTIEAFDLACRRGLAGRLTIAGDGPLRVTCELLRTRSDFADRIRLVGTTDAATGDRLRAEADVFTAHNSTGDLSRQAEAFGVSVVEAMAEALPVVSGRSGALPETVVQGQTGLLFDPGDVPAHAAALLTLAHDVRTRLEMGRAGWERTRTRFTPEAERSGLSRILYGESS